MRWYCFMKVRIEQPLTNLALRVAPGFLAIYEPRDFGTRVAKPT
jgi:hypothetical protein